MRGAAAVLVRATLSCALALSGCGAPCKPLATARAELAAGRETTTDPHLSIAAPHALLDALIAPRVQQLAPVPITPPLLGLVVPVLAGLQASVRSMTLRAADEGHVGMALAVDVGKAGAAWVTLHLDVQLQPEVVDGALEIQLRPGDLRGVTPTLGPEGEALLARAIGEAFGEEDRPGPEALAKAASALAGFLLAKGYEELREGLLGDLGAVARMRIALPDVPIEAVRLRSGDTPMPHLNIGIVSGLPVHTAVTATASPQPGVLAMRLSGSMLAELVNWGMAEGLLPGRFNREPEPDEQGTFRPVLDWRADSARPLLLHVLAHEPECFRLTIGARLALEVRDGKLVSRVTDGEVEAIEGSWLVQLGVALDRAGEDPIAFANERLASLRVEVGGMHHEARATQAAVHGGEATMWLVLLPQLPTTHTSSMITSRSYQPASRRRVGMVGSSTRSRTR